MAGRIKFKVNKYVHGSRSKDVFEFKPKAQIIFEGKRIGQIIDTEVYFYISVKDRTLNYIPELWGKFSTHQEAKEAVITQAEYIWKTLNIYHQTTDYGERSKETDKQLGMEKDIRCNPIGMDEYPDISMAIHPDIL